ncbi:MAG: tripartite tricarboxylate transporter substrate-binding protein [Acetivibrionales bacterium]|jgi:tripartite-type tricarboxylate transporter receptor subunit TctC
MKRLITVLLVTILALSVAACGTQAPTTSATPEPAATPPATGEPTTAPSPQATSSVDTNNFYHGKIITWIVPWAAGGATDVMSRELANLLSKELGVTCVILNTDGGGGLVGFNTLIASPKDGFTIGSISPSMLLFKPTGKANISYDAADFLCMSQTVPTCLVVKGDSQFKSLDEIIAYAKDHPGELRYGNSGIGAIYHLVGEAMAKKAGVKFTAVPYESGTAGATAAAGGHVEFAICSISEAAAMIDAGELSPLAVFGDSPSAKYPDVPTTTKLGYEGLMGTWTGVAAPQGIPAEARELLMKTFEEIIKGEEWAAFEERTGNNPYFMGGEEFTKFLKEQDDTFAQILAK